MLTEDRFLKIKEIVDANGSATVTELMSQLDASESTLRRDLRVMDERGLITRVHGGAVAKESASAIITYEKNLLERQSINTEDKETIGKYAASLIKEGDFVYIDSGSSTEIMARYITEKNAVYVTNCISVARQLASMGMKVYLLGGEFKVTTEAIVGEEAVSNIKKYNFSKGFFGTNGVSRKRGFTTPEMREGVVKREAMLHTKEKYILADYTKFDGISSINFCSYEEAVVVTTGKIPSEYCSDKNIFVVK
ncbi:MAG: DeoR/GlpR family DNA-binding transcription regulator [Saccharofermentans sp.]|nr:DeoR/GlpR family DNA-binding transcription regulator [Saccharofermentans sp.]